MALAINPLLPVEWQVIFILADDHLREQARTRQAFLNLTDQDYRLNPLTFYSERPRERVFTVSCGFRF